MHNAWMVIWRKAEPQCDEQSLKWLGYMVPTILQPNNIFLKNLISLKYTKDYKTNTLWPADQYYFVTCKQQMIDR